MHVGAGDFGNSLTLDVADGDSTTYPDCVDPPGTAWVQDRLLRTGTLMLWVVAAVNVTLQSEDDRVCKGGYFLS